MIITDMFGVMYLWNIQLNAISVVNIVMVSFKTIQNEKLSTISFWLF